MQRTPVCVTLRDLMLLEPVCQPLALLQSSLIQVLSDLFLGDIWGTISGADTCPASYPTSTAPQVVRAPKMIRFSPPWQGLLRLHLHIDYARSGSNANTRLRRLWLLCSTAE